MIVCARVCICVYVYMCVIQRVRICVLSVCCMRVYKCGFESVYLVCLSVSEYVVFATEPVDFWISKVGMGLRHRRSGTTAI